MILEIEQTGKWSFKISRDSLEAIVGRSQADQKTAKATGGEIYAKGAAAHNTALVGFIGEAGVLKLLSKDPEIQIGQVDDGYDGTLSDGTKYDVKTSLWISGKPLYPVYGKAGNKMKRKTSKVYPGTLIHCVPHGRITQDTSLQDISELTFSIRGQWVFSFEKLFDCNDCWTNIETGFKSIFNTGLLCKNHNSFGWVKHKNKSVPMVNIVPLFKSNPIADLGI